MILVMELLHAQKVVNFGIQLMIHAHVLVSKHGMVLVVFASAQELEKHMILTAQHAHAQPVKLGMVLVMLVRISYAQGQVKFTILVL